jgi:hypothetical protein
MPPDLAVGLETHSTADLEIGATDSQIDSKARNDFCGHCGASKLVP